MRQWAPPGVVQALALLLLGVPRIGDAGGLSRGESVVVVAHFVQWDAASLGSPAPSGLAQDTLNHLETRLARLQLQVVPYERYRDELQQRAPQCLGENLGRPHVLEPPGPSMLYFHGEGRGCVKRIQQAARRAGADHVALSTVDFQRCDDDAAKVCIWKLEILFGPVRRWADEFETEWGFYIANQDDLGSLLLEELDPERQYALVLDYAIQRVGLPEDELVPADPSER
jgi:hypothetical protein